MLLYGDGRDRLDPRGEGPVPHRPNAGQAVDLVVGVAKKETALTDGTHSRRPDDATRSRAQVDRHINRVSHVRMAEPQGALEGPGGVLTHGDTRAEARNNRGITTMDTARGSGNTRGRLEEP